MVKIQEDYESHRKMQFYLIICKKLLIFLKNNDKGNCKMRNGPFTLGDILTNSRHYIKK